MLRTLRLAVFVCFVASILPAQAHGPTFWPNQQPLLPLDSTIDDVSYVSRHWGQLSTYKNLPPGEFGVKNVGLPDGCQLEQVHLLQRHAERFPHPGDEQDGLNIEIFTRKVSKAIEAGKTFEGPLEFINTWRNMLGGELLTGTGAMAEIASGVQFWNTYGRALYNASSGQLGYRPDDAERKPLLRGTTQSRIHNSLMNWSLGFFGPSYQQTAAFPKNWTDYFRTIVIPEDSVKKWNNTLASQHCCNNSQVTTIGDNHMWNYTALYSSHISHRLSKYTPKHFHLSVKDTYAMQLLCAYETQYLGVSEFCSLFTRNEWEGFENSLDIRFFYNHAFGNPTARAQGIGYVEELLARLQGKLINESDSSVNSSITNNEEMFPLGMKFYADFTHDKMVLGALTALSIDHFKHLPNLHQYPPDKNRLFKVSHLVPFTARLITEIIGCDSAHPKPEKHERVRYYASQYGYDSDTKEGKHRFVRMKLNGAVLPLSSARGGACKGRTDEMCPLENFVESQEKAKERANYREACFGDYEVPTDGRDLDGTVPKE
ncbi:phosphoglycerate mutase-like protein [Lentithecium fluviatile CBS 122367]|uniref:Phosphoglycerate mutase-like protein n=1 Tax=Lentithecium fluviatile CBS 122367 TaxID=1168545 RepID=A0A6G1IV72_9PLEO|nr:phosphoglycerate mutase-like protein [Lentithecium fluviatile CBS 122367]